MLTIDKSDRTVINQFIINTADELTKGDKLHITLGDSDGGFVMIDVYMSRSDGSMVYLKIPAGKSYLDAMIDLVNRT